MQPTVRLLKCTATPSGTLLCLCDACLTCLHLSAGVLSPSASERWLSQLCLDAVHCTAVFCKNLSCSADAAMPLFR